MADLIKMPKLGLTMEEGTVSRWLKREGDYVSAGEVYLEIENDKATFEVQAEHEGVLRKILAEQGAVLPVTTPIAIIGSPDESIESLLTDVLDTESPLQFDDLSSGTPSGSEAQNEKARINASPAARKIASECGLDLADVRGSGPGGRITRGDVLAAAKTCASSCGASTPLVFKRIPLSGIRKTIGKVTSHSKQTIPHFYVTADLDLTDAISWRQTLKSRNEKAPSITAIVAHGVCQCIPRHPVMNAQLEEDSISVFATINLGIAIALSDGLVVANLPSAEGKSLLELDEQILQTTERVRSQKFTEEDLTGSTFTISNLGQYGIRTFAAVIHPPEAAILALGRCEQRVVVVAGRVEIRWVMSVTLSCDHRIIDGATAGLFLNCLSEAIKHYA